jgi:hypothetical protein
MKNRWFVLALLLTPGCLHPNTVPDPRQQPTTVVAPAPTPPPVTEAEVTEQNAIERAWALRQELERETARKSADSSAGADVKPTGK